MLGVTRGSVGNFISLAHLILRSSAPYDCACEKCGQWLDKCASIVFIFQRRLAHLLPIGKSLFQFSNRWKNAGLGRIFLRAIFPKTSYLFGKIVNFCIQQCHQRVRHFLGPVTWESAELGKFPTLMGSVGGWVFVLDVTRGVEASRGIE